jgi:RNA-directed DNA polymerase
MQGGSVRDRWSWVEPTVWTDRMLETLERGVKGGKWFSLIDKVYSMSNLRASWEKVRRNKGAAGVDRQSVARFEANSEKYLTEISSALRTGQYRPLAVRRQWIDKPGSSKKRPLGIPAVKDRVVQGALRHVLEPLWEMRFIEHSYGFRPNRGCKDALRRVQHLLDAGYRWVVDADITSFFDTIPHDRLMKEVEKEVADGRVTELIRLFLEQSILEGVTEWQPDRGTPQGAVISPLLANIYLHPVDCALKTAGYEVVRYADDLVILCRSRAEAERALALLTQQIEGLGLSLHPEKTKVVDESDRGGFDFLGYHFERSLRWPRAKSQAALKDKVRARTPRKSGRSLCQIVDDLNPILRGWFNYFQHSHPTELIKLDKWIRMRLRSVLRTFNKRKGRGQGTDHFRWPNAFFRAAGLFIFHDARQAIVQSRCGNH